MPVACLSANAAEFRVTALTPEYILVQGDCSADENAAFFADPRFEESKSAGADWQIRRKRVALHEDIVKKVREPFAEKLKSIQGVVAYWPEANGMKHYVAPDGDHFNLTAGEVIHNVFVKVATMKKGDSVDLGVAGKFTYDPGVPSPVFKVNQVGYAPNARKYAYVGAWLGTAGPMPLASFAEKPFAVVDAKSGAKVLEGKLAPRVANPRQGRQAVQVQALQRDYFEPRDVRD